MHKVKLAVLKAKHEIKMEEEELTKKQEKLRKQKEMLTLKSELEAANAKLEALRKIKGKASSEEGAKGKLYMTILKERNKYLQDLKLTPFLLICKLLIKKNNSSINL